MNIQTNKLNDSSGNMVSQANKSSFRNSKGELQINADEQIDTLKSIKQTTFGKRYSIDKCEFYHYF
jgi:hypothetical protein